MSPTPSSGSFFSSGPASQAYEFNRDDETRADVREYCEALWRRYEPLNGDPHFLSDAKENFHARTWEMILTCALLDHGLQLVRPPSDGPDIQIPSHDGVPTVWIEAVTVELGTGGDHAARIEYQPIGEHGALFHTQPDKTALRYTSALASKAKQRQEFIDRGIVAPSDIFVVAINGAVLHDYSSGDSDPEVLKAVYPFGDAYISIPVGGSSAAPVEHGYHHRGHVTKASGTEIATDGFLTGAYAGVSALLYSRTTAWNPQPRCRDYMLTIHNKTATTPLPHGYFAFGREALAEADQIVWRKHPAVSVATG